VTRDIVNYYQNSSQVVVTCDAAKRCSFRLGSSPQPLPLGLPTQVGLSFVEVP